jgi:pyruvate kinase
MKEDLAALSAELEKIDAAMLQAEEDFARLLHKVHPAHEKNAVNLLHYLALRSLDIRALQDALHEAGLSSMTSSESHVRGQLLAIERRLGLVKETPPSVFTYEASKTALLQKSHALFGEKASNTIPHIMLTFDASLADDYSKVKELLLSGMNVARINCAHDDEEVWLKMIQHIHRASKATDLGCKIYMDLAGPKIRTITKKNEKLKIELGQYIYLTDAQDLGKDKSTIGCTLPNITAQLKPGEFVLFDDGLIKAIVEEVEPHRATLKILRISSKKPVIKPEKGINFPDSVLLTPALTEYDKQCLPFIKKHADILGYSFVRDSKDILELFEALGLNHKLALVLKIETPQAVKNFPDLLFTAMQRENIGIMIARGDLAVEIGFERISEVQEELLWISEAAHVPVIWATQVLENLNKSGMATRSEVTDAAHASRADCVMINKGNYLMLTLETLRDILLRSGGHHVKKRYTFRPLSIAMRFIGV